MYPTIGNLNLKIPIATAGINKKYYETGWRDAYLISQ